MFDKLKLKSMASNLPKVGGEIGEVPSKRDIYRSRQNFGTNIGGCFIIEKWIYHDIFPDGANCELEAVSKWISITNAGDTQRRFEEHWSNFLNGDDWRWLQERHITSLRIPIGYWEVDGGRFARGTKFEDVAGIYKNAWKIFKEKFIEPAAAHNISILVDLHGLPGGANDGDHGGEHPGGQGSPEFWKNESAQLSMAECVKFIARDLLPKYDNVCGIQIVNESVFSEDAKRQQRYYGASVALIRSEDGNIPIVISDGWWTDQWVKWIQGHHRSDGDNLGIIIDAHVYRCHSEADKNKSPQQIVNDLAGDVLTNLTDNCKGADVMVGEFSCVIDGRLWGKENADSRRDQLVIDYGKRQTQLFNERANYGNYFWTFKFQSGNGGEWDFRTMYNKGAINGRRVLGVPDNSKLEEKLRDNLQGHSNYWNQQNPIEQYEHWRYEDGFRTAWKDALEFAKFDGSRIGRVEFWKSMRVKEYIQRKGALRHLWEWYEGFSKGLKEFES